MPRSVWSGSLSFGLVNVPVRLVSAVRDHDARFRQLDKDGARIRYKRVSERTGEEVPYESIVKGYEISKGRYVRFDADELEKLAPQATHTIDVQDFVALDAIDPLYFEKTYYVIPEERAGAAKAYALLLQAMRGAGKVAIGTIVMREKQHLAAVRPLSDGLALSTMRFSDEVVDPEPVPIDAGAVSSRELDLANQIIESLSTAWEPERYQDTYRTKIEELAAAKVNGDEVIEPVTDAPPAATTDLMAALRASLEHTRSRPHEPARRGRRPRGTSSGTEHVDRTDAADRQSEEPPNGAPSGRPVSGRSSGRPAAPPRSGTRRRAN